MIETCKRGACSSHSAYALLHRATLIALIFLIGLITGCERDAQQPPPPRPIDASHVQVVAWLDGDSPCQQGTIEILRTFEDDSPDQLAIKFIDIGTPEGQQHLQEHGLDAVAIEIGGHTTVSWGEGDSRRVVTFMHPAGFTWNHKDLRAALEAALDGNLLPADPTEAEGVRLMHVTARGQSIRAGDNGNETGQLVIQDEIVLEITQSRGELTPGQRVTIAADALTEVLQQPFTPNQLTLEHTDEGVAVVAEGVQLLVATPSDVDEQDNTPTQLAGRWRFAVRQALITAALQRAMTPEPVPIEPQLQTPGEAETPANTLTDPLLPVE